MLSLLKCVSAPGTVSPHPAEVDNKKIRSWDEQRGVLWTLGEKGIKVKESRRLTEETLLSSPGLGKLPNIASIYIAWKLH